MIPEDVQVHSATSDEIRQAVGEIVHEELHEEGIALSAHDLDLLAQSQIRYWKDRPIKVNKSPLL